MDKEKKVGDKRKFTFDERLFSIREVLDAPGIELMWTWTTGVCPNCKKKLIRETNHTFYRIEILAVDGKKDSDATIEDLQIMGDTTDRRRMILPLEKYDEVLSHSKVFKKLMKQGG